MIEYLLSRYQRAYAAVNTLVALNSLPPVACPETESLMVDTVRCGEESIDILLEVLEGGDLIDRFKEDEEYRSRVLYTFATDTSGKRMTERFADSLISPREPNGKRCLPPVTTEDGPLVVVGLVNYCTAYNHMDLVGRLGEALGDLGIDHEKRLSVIEGRVSDWGNKVLETELFPPLAESGRFTKFLNDKDFQKEVLVRIAESREKKRWKLFCRLAADQEEK